MASKNSSQIIGYRYFMTMQMGLGVGPIDEIVNIKVGDKNVWPTLEGQSEPYSETVKGNGTTNIRAASVFGGEDGEGGVDGTLTVQMGAPDQIYPAWFKNMLGGDMPDFRGVVTAIFDGMICAINPYPKSWEFRVRRTEKGWQDDQVWQPTYVTIWLANSAIKAMNPAHILYEVITNKKWGRGFDKSRIADTVWLEAARTLYNEGFGLCIPWKRQQSLRDFIQEILDHIGGAIYLNRETGLIDLKLIRDDYNVDDLPLFDYNSGLLSINKSETAALTDAVSEIVVRYHDPIKNEDLQVRAQNLALMQATEGVKSSSVSYLGIPTQELAARIAQRDLKATAASANRYTVTLDRRAWRVYPGAVFRISAPDRGINNLVLRAGKVTDSTFTDGKITIEASLDVFGMPSVSFVAPEPSTWEPPLNGPSAIDAKLIREATYYDMIRTLSEANLAYVTNTSAALSTVAGRNDNQALSYIIRSRPDGGSFANYGGKGFAPYCRSVGALSYYNGTITFDSGQDLSLIESTDLIQIGDEFMGVTNITYNADGISGTMDVSRGCLDTIPQEHAHNSPIFFIDGNIASDEVEYAAGETIEVKLLSQTSAGSLDPDLAATTSLILSGRQARPYPPGALFVVHSGGAWTPCFNAPPFTGDFQLQWTHRDRITQEDFPTGHWEANVGPETGVTYNVRFYNSSNTLLRSITGISDNFINFGAADTDLVGALRVEVESYRDGLASHQKYDFPLTRSL